MKVDFSKRCSWIIAATAVVCLVPVCSGAQSNSQPSDQTATQSAEPQHHLTAEEYAAKQAQVRKEAAAQPTPRLADGHPDLTGVWGGQGVGAIITKDAQGVLHVLAPTKTAPKDVDPDGISVYYNQQIGVEQRRASTTNLPPYKPELMAKVRELDKNSNELDPGSGCVPEGPPRSFPTEIFATDHYLVFLYTGEGGSHYRLVPTDGGPHPADAVASYFGDSVGHWEGDTLVIDVTNFNDKTWLGTRGWFHTDAMHVVERFSRQGNVLHYQATVEDPNVFTKPWVENPRDVVLAGGGQHVYEDLPCVDRDRGHYVNHDHI